MWTVVYVLSIVVVNYGFSVIPPIALPTGDMWPPMSLVVGLIFVLRDFAQREIGHWVILAMLVGGALSYVMANPYVAIASVTAFLVSEAIDWAIYTFTRRPFRERILLSSLISTPADSVVFLGMIGLLGPVAFVLMTASKLIAAVLVWRLAKA